MNAQPAPMPHHPDCCCRACVELERLEHPERYAEDADPTLEADYVTPPFDQHEAKWDRDQDEAEYENDVLACDRSELSVLI